MHYFFLEKQSNLTQRWKVRQVAFDAKYRYLYYSKPLSRTDIEEVMTRGQEADGATAAAHSGFASPTSSGGTSTRKVKWSGKVKVTQLRYAADEYIVPPSSEDFNEGILLTLIVVGYERSLEHRPRRTGAGGGGGSVLNRSLNTSSENSFSHRSNASWFRSTSRLSSVRPDSAPDTEADDDDPRAASSAEQPLLANADANEAPVPESPSGFIHMPSYPVNESLDEDFEDEDENMFRDIDLVPDDDEEEEEETSLAASDGEPETEATGEDEEDDEDDVALNSPPSSPSESAISGYSFFSLRRRPVGGGPSGAAKDEKTVQLQFRAANYDVFRIVSLRVRQALVRHGLCGPLHAGLPPYDPRNGIALATVPLHLRHAFRRLNDVVFYSLQIGHVVYVRQQREVRGMEGYLCITHDSILLLQLDGKCPRWIDLEDIVGVQYVLRDNHSFISIRAAEPYPDFVFIPIIPSYPPNSTFDAAECVEGIVSMVRRLLMQRLRAGEEVALAPVSSRRACVHTAEDTDEYDILCHIDDLSNRYADVFKYIAQEQSAGATPLRWRWDNSKTPTHFTFKRDLYQALEREEGEDSEDDDETSPSRSQRRPFLAPATHAQLGEAVVPPRQQQMTTHSRNGGSLSALLKASSSARRSERFTGASSTTSSVSHGVTPPRAEQLSREGSLYSNASFHPATMTQLMAPPSRGAEMRAKQRLQVTRTDRRNVSPARGADGDHTTAVNTTPRTDTTAAAPLPPTLPAKAAIATASMGTIPRSSNATGVRVTSVPSSTQQRRGMIDTPPPPPHTQTAAAAGGGRAPQEAVTAVSGHSRGDTSGRPHTPEPQLDTTPPAATNTAAAGVQRPASSRPNTYGLVPSTPHVDPTGLDYWLSATTPVIAPVATAQKGVHLSDIHSSMQQQTSVGAVTTGGGGGGGGTPGSCHLGTTPATTMNTVTGAAAAGGGAASGSNNRVSGSGSNAGFSALPSSHSLSSGLGAVGGGGGGGGPSSSAGPRESATNGSRSPQEVTHTTENVSADDEESDEDFDSEDMEDMLQRPESRGLAPPSSTHDHASVASPVSATGGAAGAQTASDSGAAMAASSGTPAGVLPDMPGFVHVGEGVVTPAVLTADLLPGFRPREADRRSDTASAPSPSLQARPDMLAFIPPAVLPK